MSKMDELKNKIRSSSGSSVHPELIDTSLESKPVKPKKKKFEELYKRDTVWLENDLKKSLMRKAQKGEKGKKLVLSMRLLECTLGKIDISSTYT